MLAFKFKKRTIHSKERILINRWNERAGLGDTIIITPLFKAIKKAYPNSIVDVLVGPDNGSVLANNPFIDNIFVLPKFSLKGIISILIPLRKNNYDIVLDCREVINSHAILISRTVAKNVLVGIQQWGKYGLTSNDLKMYDYLLESSADDHYVDIYTRFLKLIGINEYDTHYDLYINNTNVAKEVNKFLLTFKENKNRIVFVNLFASIPERSLGIEYAKNLIRRLLEETAEYEELVFVLNHNGSNLQIVEKIVNAINSSRVMVSVACKNMDELMFIIQESELILTVETSIVHFASAFQKPLICLFVNIPLYNKRFAPVGHSSTMLVSDSAYSLESIPIDRVTKAVKDTMLLCSKD